MSELSLPTCLEGILSSYPDYTVCAPALKTTKKKKKCDWFSHWNPRSVVFICSLVSIGVSHDITAGIASTSCLSSCAEHKGTEPNRSVEQKRKKKTFHVMSPILSERPAARRGLMCVGTVCFTEPSCRTSVWLGLGWTELLVLQWMLHDLCKYRSI